MSILMLPEPTKKRELAKAVESCRLAAWRHRNVFLVLCQLAFYYLRGYRDFKLMSLSEGRLMVGYETDLGKLKFRNEDLRRKFLTELGRYMKMDLSPVIRRRSWGLDSMRKSAIAQVAIDYIEAQNECTTVDLEFLQHFLIYGMVGLAHWRRYDGIGKKMVSEKEVVPGWEIVPVPACPVSDGQVRALLRHRMFPLTELEKRVAPDGMDGLKLTKGEGWREKMRVTEISYGSNPDPAFMSEDTGEVAHAFADRNESDNNPNAKKKDSEEFVPLSEMWVVGPNYTVNRFVVCAGDMVLYDSWAKSGGPPVKPEPMPIKRACHTPDSGFYPYGYVGMLISGNHRVEKMLQQLYKNVEELDQFGTMMWPSTAGAGIDEFNKPNGRPKAVQYEMDYTVPEQKPFSVQPTNTGDFPGRVAAMGDERQDKIAAHGPMLSGHAAGRTETAAGHGVLFEMSQIAMAASAHQVADAYAQIYRSVLASCKSDWTDATALKITNIDANIAGIVVKDDGSVELADNPLPEWWEVEVDVKDRKPFSREQRKLEMREELELQNLDPTEYRLMSYRENLDLPVGNRKEFEAYRKATYQCIKLFGNGQVPGNVVDNLILDDPMTALRAFREFTARLEFSFASAAVRRAFEVKIQNMEQQAVGEYPEAMGPLENLEQMQGPPMDAAGMMGGMGGGMPSMM